MASTNFKKRTPEQQWNSDRSRIHALLGNVKKARPEYSDENYRDTISIISKGRCESSKELTPAERITLIEQLTELAGEAVPKKKGTWTKKGYPNRPTNMDTPGESRDAQLGKIEALLTIGGLSWAYADGIAKQMRLADKVQWVPAKDLFRIITALTKKAQKENWDLSGAR
ncbi:MAG: hypothetical protein A2075_12075 [Geobacteraceae bacterium GWC2_58_44]|nr:MAG: hypothetical protein A2075_12075 [Geobacteraceae bacterium GWC2_58_44]HBG06299.1 hypothetical protein [Geobacter sp.]